MADLKADLISEIKTLEDAYQKLSTKIISSYTVGDTSYTLANMAMMYKAIQQKQAQLGLINKMISGKSGSSLSYKLIG